MHGRLGYAESVSMQAVFRRPAEEQIGHILAGRKTCPDETSAAHQTHRMGSQFEDISAGNPGHLGSVPPAFEQEFSGLSFVFDELQNPGHGTAAGETSLRAAI